MIRQKGGLHGFKRIPAVDAGGAAGALGTGAEGSDADGDPGGSIASALSRVHGRSTGGRVFAAGANPF